MTILAKNMAKSLYYAGENLEKHLFRKKRDNVSKTVKARINLKDLEKREYF